MGQERCKKPKQKIKTAPEKALVFTERSKILPWEHKTKIRAISNFSQTQSWLEECPSNGRVNGDAM